MIEEMQSLHEGYLGWLRSETEFRELDDWVEITTPFLDRHNDRLQIYARREKGGYLLTDDGYVLEDLEQSGCDVRSSGRRQAILSLTLNGFGVSEVDNALRVNASADDFGQRKHDLVQAMLAVNDIFYVVQPAASTGLFHEDVAGWFDAAKVRYTPNVKFTGVSGYDHLFGFVIPKSDEMPERIVRSFNYPTRTSAQSMAFSWVDTKDARPAEAQAYAILNDAARAVSGDLLDAMRRYDVRPVRWSEREGALAELAA